MKIKAKYPGKCRKCGGAIRAGESIDWERGVGTSHIECPVALKPTTETYQVSRGQYYGGPFREGQVVHSRGRTMPDGKEIPEKYGIVLKAWQRYIREDGLSFGVGDDSGYLYYAQCRLATAEEIAAHKETMAEQERIKEGKLARERRLAEIKETIKVRGDRLEGVNEPVGVRFLDTANIYGGGDWFVVSDTEIWYVKNNGADGDDWSLNNVRTGGAGAIGWRIAYESTLADEIKGDRT